MKKTKHTKKHKNNTTGMTVNTKNITRMNNTETTKKKNKKTDTNTTQKRIKKKHNIAETIMKEGTDKNTVSDIQIRI